jgi:sortase (surface protein transpeptidase)
MKAVLLLAAVTLASLALAAPSGTASAGCAARAVSPHVARLTIKALHIRNKPIRTRACDLAYGPIWDLAYRTRPGMGLTMVIDAHDVTPVRGYGAHGPFYNLNRIRPGYQAKIEWNGVWRTYRFVSRPRAYPQRPASRINKHIKSSGVETIYFRCCWPRYTREDYLTARAVLVGSPS